MNSIVSSSQVQKSSKPQKTVYRYIVASHITTGLACSDSWYENLLDYILEEFTLDYTNIPLDRMIHIQNVCLHKHAGLV